MSRISVTQTESDTLTSCVTIHITATQIITEVKRMIPQKTQSRKNTAYSARKETIPEQKAEPAPEKRIRKEKKHKSGRFKKWWKNIPAAPVMEYVPNAKRGRFDMPLFTVVIILLVMGIIMMSSASYAYALQEEGNSFAYAQKTACCGGGRICRDDNFVTHRLSYVGKAVQNDRQK